MRRTPQTTSLFGRTRVVGTVMKPLTKAKTLSPGVIKHSEHVDGLSDGMRFAHFANLLIFTVTPRFVFCSDSSQKSWVRRWESGKCTLLKPTRKWPWQSMRITSWLGWDPREALGQDLVSTYCTSLFAMFNEKNWCFLSLLVFFWLVVVGWEFVLLAVCVVCDGCSVSLLTVSSNSTRRHPF